MPRECGWKFDEQNGKLGFTSEELAGVVPDYMQLACATEATLDGSFPIAGYNQPDFMSSLVGHNIRAECGSDFEEIYLVSIIPQLREWYTSMSIICT